jgi:hypothetical protein
MHLVSRVRRRGIRQAEPKVGLGSNQAKVLTRPIVSQKLKVSSYARNAV